MKSVGGQLFAWLVHLRQVHPLKLAGSVNSVSSVGEYTQQEVLCKSVKSVGGHPQQSKFCGRHFAAAEARIPPLLYFPGVHKKEVHLKEVHPFRVIIA